MTQDYNALIEEAKSLSGLTADLEGCLKEIAPIVLPHLKKVTELFYVRLVIIPNTSRFLEPRMNQLDHLKQTHLNWLNSLFTVDINADFAKEMSRVGDVHVSIQLPIDFMSGSMTLLNKEIAKIIVEELGHDKVLCTRALQAVVAVTGLVLIIMQKSYQLWE